MTAFLKDAGAPVRTWESFVQIAQHDGMNTDAANERDATQERLSHRPDREWYLETVNGCRTTPMPSREKVRQR